MRFGNSMRKILAARGYRHCKSDEEFTRHGQHARNIQFVFSKEFQCDHGNVVDLVFLGADMDAERMVIGFFREDLSVEKGVLQNSSVSFPLASFSLDEFERQLDRLIPKGDPLRGHSEGPAKF